MAEVPPRSNGSLATVQDKFDAALNVIKSLPKNGSYKPDPRMMLKFYSYYKQATEGPCTKPKPWAWDVINKAKWEAWSKLGNMPREKAMEEYVENLKLIIEVMPATDNVQSFIQTLGSFYELVELEPPEQFKKHSKQMTSTPHRDAGEPHLNGHSEPHHKMNGDIPSDSSDSENEEIPVNGHHDRLPGEEDTPRDKHEESGQESERQSDSEDEFCDTAEEIQASDSPMHSYTMVNNDGQAESSTKSDSLSTLDSTVDAESPSYDQSCSTVVKVRTRGGEHGTRGSDGTSFPQRGPNHLGERSDRSQQRELDTPGRYPGASGGAGGSGRGPPYSYSEVQDQIATTLLQLQQDMNSVLNRLSILEALTVGQQARRRTTSGDSSASSSSPRHMSRSRNVAPSWWPFRELSPKTFFFIIAWPFVAKWIIHVLNKRRTRH